MIDGEAYFISPAGVIIGVPSTHIALVIEMPALYGVSSDFVHERYTSHGEAMGVEGRARIEILQKVL